MRTYGRKLLEKGVKALFSLAAAGLLLAHAGHAFADSNQILTGEVAIDGVKIGAPTQNFDGEMKTTNGLTPLAQKVFNQKIAAAKGAKAKVFIAPVDGGSPKIAQQGGALAKFLPKAEMN